MRRGYDGQLRIGTLPVSMFCNGHTNFVQHMPERLGLKPFSLHAIYQYSAEAGKRHRFRESLVWNVSPCSTPWPSPNFSPSFLLDARGKQAALLGVRGQEPQRKTCLQREGGLTELMQVCKHMPCIPCIFNTCSCYF